MQSALKRALMGACGGVVALSPLLAAGAVAHAKPLAGRTFYVSTTGNDGNSGSSCGHGFATIQHAVNVAISGDSIIVCPGHYLQDDIIVPPSKTLDIRGEGHPTICADGANFVLVIESSHSVVNSLRAECSAIAGIEVVNASHVAITDNDAFGNVFGIMLNGASHSEVYGNVADFNEEGGIFLTDNGAVPCHDNIVSENQANNNEGSAGIYLFGFGHLAGGVSDNEIVSNVTDDNGTAPDPADGILLLNSAEIGGNVFGNLVASNDVDGNGGPGIVLTDQGLGNMNDNTIRLNDIGTNNVNAGGGGGGGGDLIPRVGDAKLAPHFRPAISKGPEVEDTDTTGVMLTSIVPIVDLVTQNIIDTDQIGIWATRNVSPADAFANNVFMSVPIPIFIAPSK